MNTKMKVLSLALVGLCGYAGSAMAACPTAPTAWTSTNTGGSGALAISTPGYASTECKLEATVGTASNTRALVVDESPNNEPRYRAAFYFNTSALTGVTASNRQATIFNAFAATSPAGAASDEINVSMLGTASGPALRIVVADASQPSKFRTITATLPSSASKTYFIEFDLTQGTAANNFKYWLYSAEDTTVLTEANFSGQATVDTTGWGGVDTVNLGLFSTTAGFRSNAAGQALKLDQFDSRRQTLIAK